MIWIRYCLLLVVIVMINADTNDTVTGQSRRPSFLQKIIDFIHPYIFDSFVITANNSLENTGDVVKNDSFVYDYHLTDDQSEEGDIHKFLLHILKKKKKKNKRKKKKPVKGKPQKPDESEESYESDESDESEEKPSKPSRPSKPHRPVFKPIAEPSPHDGIMPPISTGESEPQKLEMDAVDETTKLVKDSFLHLANFIPKRKVIHSTSTVLVHTTVVNTIYPSCLEMRNVHSVCEGNLVVVTPSKALPSGNIWRSQSTDLDDSKAVDENREGRNESFDTTENVIKPSATISVGMTKVATLDGNPSRSFNAVTSVIEETESTSEELTSEQTATPHLMEGNKENDTSALRILPHFLEPIVDHSTEYVHITKTKDFYDNSHTATVIAINCLPKEAKSLPLCPSDKHTAHVLNPVETYHSNFLQMIKAGDHIVPSLSQESQSYLSTAVLPPYHEVSANKDFPMDERILVDALQRIQKMIFEYVMSEQIHRNLGKRHVDRNQTSIQ